MVAVTEGGGLEWYIPLLTTEGRKKESEGFSTRGSVVYVMGAREMRLLRPERPSMALEFSPIPFLF